MAEDCRTGVAMTNLWTIDEYPGYTVERTPGAWALWAPCKCIEDGVAKEDCPDCGGEGELVTAVCGIAADGTPADKAGLFKDIPLDALTLRRIQ